jgi:transketolase
MKSFATLSMRDAFAQAAIELAPEYPNLIVLDADVSKSTRSAVFGQAYPDRFLNLGIAEQNMMSIAAGLAAAGMTPVLNSFSMLLSLRALDQLRQSVAYTRLNVKIMGHYGGYSAGPEGASHHAIEDLAILRAIPNLVILVPCDAVETRQALRAALAYQGPVYVRLCRNSVPAVFDTAQPFQIGRGYELRQGADVAIIAIGIMAARALAAGDILAAAGISTGVVAMPTLKPIDRDLIEHVARDTGAIVTAEEHTINGGLGGAVAEVLAETLPVPMERVGIADCFAESGDYLELLDKYGLGVQAIVAAARRVLERKAGHCARRS